MNMDPGDYIIHANGTVTHRDGTPVSLTEEQQRMIAEHLWEWRRKEAKLLEEWARSRETSD